MSDNERMTIKEHIRIARRAVKWCFELEKKFTLCLFAYSVLTAIVPFVPVYFSARVIDVLAASAPIEEAVLYAALAVGITALLRLAVSAIDSIKQPAEADIYRCESCAYADKALNMDYTNVESRDVAMLRERIRVETQTGFNRFFLHNSIEQLTGQVTRIISALSLSASFFMLEAVPLAWKLALCIGVAVSVFTSSAITGRLGFRFRQEYGSDCVRSNMLCNKYDEYVANYALGQDVRLYNMEDMIADGNTVQESQFLKSSALYDRRMTLLQAPVTLFRHLLQFTAYGALIVGAVSGGVSAGSIARYVSSLMILFEAVESLIKSMRLAFENDLYLKRYFSFFDIPNNMYQGTLTVEKRDDNEYQIEFCDVSFKYPDSESYALRHVNLAFKIGEKLAVVGMNGSGKSTFIKLLCRLYDPTEGEIRLNGVDIRKYDYDEYMSLFSVVFQDFKLFSLTLGQVVASGKTFDEARVRECLEKAHFKPRSDALPQGVHTFLHRDYDKSGVEFSGGEMQKIALARALYKDAPFMLLDEPTAALDPVSEYEVYSNFNAISGDKTAVYISHRLASCRFCDKIAVFDGGRVVQRGTHESLLADEGGKYHELWMAQAQYYTK